MRIGKVKATPKMVDPDGLRLIGTDLETGEPIFAPRGHGQIYSANGGGKTTRGCMIALNSYAASEPEKAVLVLDSKRGEMADQTIEMFAKMGRKVALIDDTDVLPELAQYKVSLNPFGAAVSTYVEKPKDLIFPMEDITHSLIEEPSDGDTKNLHFRSSPRNIIETAATMLLKRDPDIATPGGCAELIGDEDMLLSLARVDSDEGDKNLQLLAKSLLKMREQEHWAAHLDEAQRSLKLYRPGTRLEDAGFRAQTNHFGLIREGYLIYLVGPQDKVTRMGAHYALHIMGFTHALFNEAGSLRIIADEFTNAPLKPLIRETTTLRSAGGEILFVAQSRSECIRKFGEQETRTIEENCITKQWLGFSSFEEAERVSKAMGEEFAVANSLGSDSASVKTQTNLSLVKQPVMSPAELMAMPVTEQLVHIKGIGFFKAGTISQENVAPFCFHYADNTLEDGKLAPDPKITLTMPDLN